MGSEGTPGNSQVDTPTSRDDSLSHPGSSRERSVLLLAMRHLKERQVVRLKEKKIHGRGT